MFNFDIIANQWFSAMTNATILGSIAILVGWLITKSGGFIPSSIRSWVWRIVFLKLILAFVWVTPIELSVLPSKTEAFFLTPQSEPEVVAVNSHLEEAKNSPIAKTEIQSKEKQSNYISFNFVLFLLWFTGALASFAILTQRWLRARNIFRETSIFQDTELHSIVERMSSQFRIRKPNLYLSNKIKSPFVFGVFRPVMIVPSKFTYSKSDLELIVAHELAHIKRRDLVWSLVPSLTRVLFYFNPLIWIAENEWVKAQEIACDELAIEKTKSAPLNFSKLLLSIVEKNLLEPTYQMTALSIAESKESIKSRIIAITRLRKVSPSVKRTLYFVTAISAAVVLIPWKLSAQKVDVIQKLIDRMNVGFESPFVEHAKAVKISYDGVHQDFEIFHSGLASARISRISETGKRPRLWMCFDGSPLRGKRLRYSGFLKTDVSSGYAALHMWIGDETQKRILGQDHMVDRGITGKTDWQKYNVIMDIPPNASMICVGAGLYAVGLGTVWVDDVSLDVVDDGTVQPTGYTLTSDLKNLDFEDGLNAAGFPNYWQGKPSTTFTTSIDTTIFEHGSSSLKLTNDEQSGNSARLFQCFLSDEFLKKDLSVSVAIRTANFDGDIVLGVIGEGKRSKDQLNNIEKLPITGTKDWQRYEISSFIPNITERICLRLQVKGKGDVWFDNIQISGNPSNNKDTPENIEFFPIKEASNLDLESNLTNHVANFRSPEIGSSWATHHPDGWQWFVRDNSEFKSGSYSARLDRASGDNDKRPELYQCINAVPYINALVRLTGYLKTNLDDGFAGLQIFIEGEDENVAADRTDKKIAPTGKQPWRKYSLEAQVPEKAKRLCFGAGVFQGASGSAWVDDLTLEAAM